MQVKRGAQVRIPPRRTTRCVIYRERAPLKGAVLSPQSGLLSEALKLTSYNWYECLFGQESNISSSGLYLNPIYTYICKVIHRHVTARCHVNYQRIPSLFLVFNFFFFLFSFLFVLLRSYFSLAQEKKKIQTFQAPRERILFCKMETSRGLFISN